jgi:hypothetical protein
MPTFNSNAKLYLSDHHGTQQYNPVKMEGKIALLEVAPLLKGTNARDLFVASPADATHLLVHLSAPERLKARAGKWPELLNTDQIILCLTTVDGFDANKFPHRIDEVEGFTRITFFSRVGKPIKDTGTFAEFCGLDIQQAKSIVEGDLTMLSPPLRRALSVNPDRYLSAIAILCQSYLILHVSADSRLHQGAKDIRGALEDMGFWVVPGKAEPIPLPADFKQKVEAMTAQWWMETLTSGVSGKTDEKARRVAARIQKEWEGLKNSGSNGEQQAEYDWGDVDALLRAVGLADSKMEDAASSEQAAPEPTLVARAYRAIRSVLMAAS